MPASPFFVAGLGPRLKVVAFAGVPAVHWRTSTATPGLPTQSFLVKRWNGHSWVERHDRIDSGCSHVQRSTEYLRCSDSPAIAVECAILNNFFWNDVWTFRDRCAAGGRAMWRRLLKYNLVSLAGLCVNVSLLWLFTCHHGVYYLLSSLVVITAASMWNYLANARWTWQLRTSVAV